MKRLTIIILIIWSALLGHALANEASALPKTRFVPVFTDQQAREFVKVQERDNGIGARLQIIGDKYEVACEHAEDLKVKNRAYYTALIALKIECGLINLDDIQRDGQFADLDMFTVWALLSRPSHVKSELSRQNVQTLYSTDLAETAGDSRLRVKKMVRAYQDKGEGEVAIKALSTKNEAHEIEKLLEEIKYDRLNEPVY